jgi:hypothetical protein
MLPSIPLLSTELIRRLPNGRELSGTPDERRQHLTLGP